MRKLLPLITLALALAACGAAGQLRPTEGKRLPVAPYGAAATPRPGDLLAVGPQQRPQRNDELLTQSENRIADPYDLPPQN